MSSDHNKLWGGRFEKPPHEEFFTFNRSLSFDYRLLESDVKGSKAHLQVLLSANVIKATELSQVSKALDELLNDVKLNPEKLQNPQIEDIHSLIESYLVQKLGDLGKRVHTGRSRNDQVATALRIWLVEESVQTRIEINSFLESLLNLAERYQNKMIPGYTHLQRAQPILWPHWCLAYVEMLFRDRERLDEIQKRLKVLPLGSGALAGSGVALDREKALEALNFSKLSANSLDGVSDRDFVLEWQSFASLLMVHLSRLSEDLIIYASSEFAFVSLGDEVSSGSSLMPQKKNPDALELIRGKTGRVVGAFMGMLTTVKGLPMAYNKDLQEDKESLFNVVDTLRSCLRNMKLVLNHVTLRDSFPLGMEVGYMEATDLADICVLRGMPFREAHEKVGQLVKEALSLKLPLGELPKSVVQNILGYSDLDLVHELNPQNCLERKSAFGGTSPQRVMQALQNARLKLVEKNI